MVRDFVGFWEGGGDRIYIQAGRSGHSANRRSNREAYMRCNGTLPRREAFFKVL